MRRDLTEEGFRLHAIHRQYTYQCNVRLPFQSLERNSSYELYQYQHFNKLPRKEERFVLSAVCREEWKLFVRRLLVWRSMTVIRYRQVMH